MSFTPHVLRYFGRGRKGTRGPFAELIRRLRPCDFNQSCCDWGKHAARTVVITRPRQIQATDDLILPTEVLPPTRLRAKAVAR
jgi:hypothetical protein